MDEKLRVTAIIFAVLPGLLAACAATADLDCAGVHRLSAQQATGQNITAGKIISDAGLNASSLIDQVFLWNITRPWNLRPWDTGKAKGAGHSMWIRPDDPVVRAIAQAVFLKPGEGIYYHNNTSLRLEINPGNDTLTWGDEYYQPPGYTLFNSTGDCDCRAIAICSLLRAMGYQAMVIRGDCPESKFMHMWVEYKVNGTVYNADFGQDSITDTLYSCYEKQNMFNDAIDWTKYDPNW